MDEVLDDIMGPLIDARASATEKCTGYLDKLTQFIGTYGDKTLKLVAAEINSDGDRTYVNKARTLTSILAEPSNRRRITDGVIARMDSVTALDKYTPGEKQRMAMGILDAFDDSSEEKIIE